MWGGMRWGWVFAGFWCPVVYGCPMVGGVVGIGVMWVGVWRGGWGVFGGRKIFLKKVYLGA